MKKKTKKTAATPIPRPNLGQFTIDPATEEFKGLRSVCEQGNPWRCLIATMGSMVLGRRMTVRLDHEERTGTIGVTVGEYRYQRAMTKNEIEFATKFDLGSRIRKPLVVRVDLSDEAWAANPKSKGGACRPGRTGTRRVRTIRARQLQAIREAHAKTTELC